MEIPPYHIPTVKGVMLRTWDRLKGFVLRAGRVIVVIVACLSILNSMGTDGTWGHEDTNESVLSEIGRTIVPVLEPMGVSEENWPAAVGIFTGVLAKEAVVGTMNSLYDSMARAKNAENGVAEEASEDEAGLVLRRHARRGPRKRPGRTSPISAALSSTRLASTSTTSPTRPLPPKNRKSPSTRST